MAVIQTVSGPVKPESVGLTLMHEHLNWGVPGWDHDPVRPHNRARAFARVVEELKAARSAGCTLLVDVTPIAGGRDVDFLVRASADSGMPIVAATGFRSELDMPGHFQRRTVDELEEIFVTELTKGMGSSGASADIMGAVSSDIPAGIIKVGTMGEHMTPLEHGFFQAAARASKRTGAAVTTHVSSGLPSPVGVISGREQLHTLIEEGGADPAKVIIGHCDVVRFPDYHLEIVRAGAFVQFDHICDEKGAVYSLPDELRVRWVLNLLEAGCEKQLLFSSDRIAHRLFPGNNQQFTYSSLFVKFLPMLRKAGVGDKTIHTIMVENPRRVLPMPDRVASRN